MAGIIALIILIYINDMLFPILNAQLGLLITAAVVCAAIVVICGLKNIQRRNGVFKRIKVIDFLFSPKNIARDRLKKDT